MEGGDLQIKQFFGEMKALDWALGRLASRVFQGTGKRFTLVLLANSPTAVAASFAEFQKVGNTWKGEAIIGGGGHDHLWSFTAAKDSNTPEANPIWRFFTQYTT